jgi:hypothetical protein
MDGIDDSTQENNNKGVVFNLRCQLAIYFALQPLDLDFCYNDFIILP